MNGENRKYRRKQHFIKRDFQFRFILKFCILLFAGLVVSTTLVFFFSKGTLTSSFQDSRLVIENTGVAILPAVIYTNLITLGLIILAAIGITLFVSHKIAGPMYRFENEMKEISRGNLSKQIKLRERDQMTDMVDGLNDMVSSLRGRISEIRAEMDRLVETTESQDVSEKTRDQIKGLRDKIDQNFVL